MQETLAKRLGLGALLTGQDIRVRRNVKDMGFLYVSLLAAFAAIAIILAFLWSKLTVVNIGYEISKANAARSSLIEHNKRLRVEFMKLKSPERIERIAVEELGLAHPQGEQIIKVK